jgi:single-strand DNA-binding protein
MNKEKGTVVQVTPLQTISDKFRKQDFTIKTFDEKFPQFLTFQVVNDKCDLVRNLNAGDVVEVSYNLRGREWTSPEGVTKYFNTVEAWSISLSSQPVQTTQAPSNENDDDLPF